MFKVTKNSFMPDNQIGRWLEKPGNPKLSKQPPLPLTTGGNQPKTDAVTATEHKEINPDILENAFLDDIDINLNDDGIIDFLRQDPTCTDLQTEKIQGETKITFKKANRKYILCNNERLVVNEDGSKQLFYINSTRGTGRGIHVINYNQKGIPESYQRFNVNGKDGKDIIKFKPEDVQGKTPSLKETGQIVFGNNNKDYIGQFVGM